MLKKSKPKVGFPNKKTPQTDQWTPWKYKTQWHALTKTNFIHLQTIEKAILIKESLKALLLGLAYGVTVQNINLDSLTGISTLIFWDFFKDNVHCLGKETHVILTYREYLAWETYKLLTAYFQHIYY